MVILSIFYFIGEQGTNVILYGAFIWVLMTCYPTMIKAQLLKDSQVHWGGKNFFILYIYGK